ncbi:glutamyl-tRNA reductase [Salinibacterium sp. SYSU T00001]|uniref:glutamyl-tRNA reductase n=1 Tax=Homoserinimonas sedimenticola TaxID=2986805 RepID=UPI0022359161|nr:glutamyl-tRNA reductase [Salinibacterium sedimenticola]MCW4384436.1 glutamyl-tRNA reductase [Salinibacterium sedimenticola]
MLVCLSANHNSASFDVLERLAAGGTDIGPRFVRDNDFVQGAVVLATCNRFEAYLDIDEDRLDDRELAARRILGALSDSTGIEEGTLRSAVEALGGEDVVHHLFAVSAGLKSVVVGEDEIAGQVRRSLDSARSHGTSTSNLERLFQKASTASRGVKTRTAIGHAGRSVVRLALQLASSRISDWSATPVLLIGTGAYAATTVAALRDRGVRDITVYSPSGRAARFATRLGLVASTDLVQALATAHVVITCTSRPEPVVTPEVMTPGLRRLVVDLGLPRNVDPAVAGIDGIELLDLETIRLHAPLEELNATSDAHEIVLDAAAEFHAREAERRAAPAIAAMRRRAFEVLEAEIERSKRRGTWSEQSEADMRHLVGVLLHSPSERARHAARDGDADLVFSAVETLFGNVDALDRERATAADAASRELPA